MAHSHFDFTIADSAPFRKAFNLPPGKTKLNRSDDDAREETPPPRRVSDGPGSIGSTKEDHQLQDCGSPRKQLQGDCGLVGADLPGDGLCHQEAGHAPGGLCQPVPGQPTRGRPVQSQGGPECWRREDPGHLCPSGCGSGGGSLGYRSLPGGAEGGANLRPGRLRLQGLHCRSDCCPALSPQAGPAQVQSIRPSDHRRGGGRLLRAVLSRRSGRG